LNVEDSAAHPFPAAIIAAAAMNKVESTVKTALGM
jgi:hypothetical protein